MMVSLRKVFVIALAVSVILLPAAFGATRTRQQPQPKKTPAAKAAPAKTAPAPARKAPASAKAPVPVAEKDLNAVIGDCGRTFSGAVKAADLENMLKGKEGFTVFEPDDSAFARLPKGELENLLKEKTTLAAMLRGHIIAGTLTAANLRGMKEVKTVEGRALAVEVKGSAITIGGATIIKADQRASNGIVQVIDKVLTAEEKAATEPAKPSPVVK